MSIKTLRKRIALVAVSALGVGVLSVTPAFAVVIVANDVDITTTVAAAPNAVCFVDADKEEAYAPVFSTGVNVQAIGAADDETGFLTISGPGYWSAELEANDAVTALNSALELEITTAEADDADAAGGTIKFTGTGTVTVTVSATSGGSAIDTITINVEAGCTSTGYSIADSYVSAQSDGTAADVTTNVDAATSASAGTPLYIQVQANNAYGANLSSGTLSASASGGLVRWGATGATMLKGTTAVATVAPDGADQLRVDPTSAAAGGSVTVTIAHNGVTVATKTVTFFGEATSIEVVKVSSGVRSGTNAGETTTGFLLYGYKSASGAFVPGSAASFDATTASIQIPAATNQKAPTAAAAASADLGLVDAIETAIGSTTYGIMNFDCAATSGSGKITIKHTSAITETVLSKEVTVSCAGGIDTYTVSTDKASYAVGEVATITITAKDSSGAAVADSTVMAVDTVSVGGGSLTRAVAATDAFTGGVRTYKAQMTTAGKFNVVVSLTGTTTTSATTSYSVGDGAVSNAEVLAAIVKLIASINKQIKALQKSLKR
jgi:hypothetical protein